MKRARFVARWLARKVARSRRKPASPIPSLAVIERITILKLDAIGDFVLSTAFMRQLEAEIPNKDVTLVVRRPIGTLAKQQFPKWDVVELPRRESAWRNVFLHGGARRSLAAIPRADLMIDLRWSRDYSDAVLASWISAKCKIAVAENATPTVRQFPLLREDEIYDKLLPPEPTSPAESTDLAQQRVLAEAVFGQKIAPGCLRPALRISSTERVRVRAMLSNDHGLSVVQPFIVVCPGAASEIREYPAGLLAEAVVQGICERPVSVVVAGTQDDRRSVDPFVKAIAGRVKTIDVVGAFSLADHVALLAEASLAVVMETSHAHIAGALGTPTVAIIGGGHFGAFAPWGSSATFRWIHHELECYHCSWECKYPRPLCIDEIPPARIAAEIRTVRESAKSF